MPKHGTPKQIVDFIDDIKADGVRNAIDNVDSIEMKSLEVVDPALIVMVRVYNKIVNNILSHLNDQYDAELYVETEPDD